MVYVRLLKMRRVLAVQILLERLADWRLRDIEARARGLLDRRRELDSFVERESVFSGLFAGAALRRLERLENLSETLTREKDAGARQRLEASGRMRQAQRIVDTLEAEARETEEADQRAGAIERAVNCRT